MKKIIALGCMTILATLLLAATAFAAPPCPGEKKLVQPEGQAITATLKGDEWLHWYETPQGDVIVRGEDSWWRYAKFENSALVPLDAKVNRDARPAEAVTGKALEKAAKKTEAAAARSMAQNSRSAQRAGGVSEPGGPQKLLVILISFTDAPLSQPDAYWSDKMFGDYSAVSTKTDADSSVNDYYKEVSAGSFYFEPAAESSGTANDGVIRVSLGMAHPLYSDTTFDNDSWTVAQQCLAAADGSIDFASLDTDGSGIITPDEVHIVMILAGGEQSYGDPDPSVWAHSYGLSSPPELDGKYVGIDYTQQGEMQGDHPATMGVLAHELGHSLGLPDLYDYGYDSLGAGVYSLMAGGSWEFNDGSNPGSSPTHLDAWSKYLLGFVTPETYYTGTHALNSVLSGGYNVIKLPTVDPNQYFLLENRQTTSGYDKPLAYACRTPGIAVWHIDYNVLNDIYSYYGGWYYINDNETHKAVDLEEANLGVLGYSQLDNNINYWSVSERYNHLYCAGSSGCNTQFSYGTTPSSRLYDGSESGAGFSISTAWADSMDVTVLGPTITSLTPDKASPQLQHRTVRWTCAATGGISRTVKFDVVKDSARTGGTDAHSSQAYFDWTPTGAGTYTITASVISTGVTTPVTQSATFIVTADTVAPVISAASGGAAIANGAALGANVTASAADPDNGTVASLSYTVNGGAPVPSWPAEFTAEGAYVLTATDQAGNAATFSFSIDKTAPQISAIGAWTLTSGMTASPNVTVTVTDLNLASVSCAKDGATYAWPSGGVFSETGSYTVTAADTLGNASSFRFGIMPYGDKLQLSTDSAYIMDGEATQSNVSVRLMDASWSIEVRIGGVLHSTWQGSELHTFTSEGVYAVTAWDSAGHSATMDVTVDRSAPVIAAVNALNSPVAAGSVHTSAVTVSVSDVTGTVNTATRGGAAYAWPSGSVFTQDGVYALSVTDAMGHSATFSFSIDLNAPDIVVDANGKRIYHNGHAGGNAAVTFADVSAVTKSAKKNGRAITWPSGGVFTSEGIYTITATDSYSRKSTLTFTLDKTFPAVKGRQSNGSSVYNGGYYRRIITVTVTDKYLAGRSVTVNGTAAKWPSRNRFTSNGSYVVTAVDKAGNTRTLSFVIDRTVPYISVKTLTGATVKRYRTAYGGAVVTVSDAWLASRTVKLGTRTVAWPADNTFTKKGTYTVTAKDKAGNTATFRFYVK